MMQLKIGRRTGYIACLDIADAVNQYSRLRNASGEGASTWPEGKLNTGKETLTISYNGRVWRKLMKDEVTKDQW